MNVFASQIFLFASFRFSTVVFFSFRFASVLFLLLRFISVFLVFRFRIFRLASFLLQNIYFRCFSLCCSRRFFHCVRFAFFASFGLIFFSFCLWKLQFIFKAKQAKQTPLFRLEAKRNSLPFRLVSHRTENERRTLNLTHSDVKKTLTYHPHMAGNHQNYMRPYSRQNYCYTFSLRITN